MAPLKVGSHFSGTGLLVNGETTSCAAVADHQCCQMLVDKPAQCPHKTSPTKIQTSPKYAIKLAVCSESNHPFPTTVAVFVQHTTDISYKATSNM